MIPPSLPEAAVLPRNSSPSSSDYSESAADAADDFSSFISQALDSFPANPAAYDQRPSTPPAEQDSSADSPLDDTNSNYLSTSDADATQSSSSTDSSDDPPHGTSDQKKSNGIIDPTVQNNLAMLLAGAFLPTIKPDHFIPAPALNTGGGNSSHVQALNPDGEAGAAAATSHDAPPQSASHPGGPAGKTPAANSPNLASSLKPVNETAPPAKDSPTSPAVSSGPAQPAAAAAKASTQAAIWQAIASMEKDGGTAAPPAGTTAALNVGTMKSNGQKTENAGRTVQKLPSTSATGNSSTGSADPSAAPIGTTGSGRKDWSSLPATFDLAIPMAAGELHDSSAAGAGPVADSPAAQVERVSNFIAQEALTIRFSGATSLAVSLKLDHQTELFVHLTNHAGQIQASLRCERGSIAGLEGHWPQLQESLARQNIQLLPPENRSFSQSDSSASGAQDFEKPAQKQRQPDTTSASAPSNQLVASTRTSKTQRKNSGRKNWESWA